VRQVVERYGRYAAFYQIGNEPSNDLQYRGTPEEYADQVRQAVAEIRGQQPSARITNGGYCNTSPAAHAIARGTAGLTDFVSYHWHALLSGLPLFQEQVAAMYREAGHPDQRYANTEMGLHIPTVADERLQAVCELQKLLWCWAHRHEGVLLYSSRELWWPRQFAYNGISDYGFVDHFFCPRFAYGATAAFLDHYAGFRFHGTLRESAGVHVYVFRKASRWLVSVFSTDKPATVALTCAARRAEVIDPMGNVTPAADATTVTLTAGEYPQSVLFHGGAEVRLKTTSAPGPGPAGR
jgi:hypothetical protein